ncbi:MAG TPA: UpxY family transcription antiterminator [Terriglobia bacterium]|nr:UpxY family transcription antiterminator [Terriglobia bacterium]
MQTMGRFLTSESPEPDHGWYAIYTRHQHEKTVARFLSDKGFETFLPVLTVVRRWKDRTKELSLPLFPCYVFLWGTLRRRIEIVTTPGFHSFVGFGDQPVSIPQEEIEAVRQALTSGSSVEPYPFLRYGDRVRINSGPLEGIEGILLRKKNTYRLVLSVELLEKSVAVEVDAYLVERVPSRNRATIPNWVAAHTLNSA